MKRTHCKHCRRPSFYLKRHLCKRCYYDDDIRAKYPIASHQLRSDGTKVINSYSPTHVVPSLPNAPTDARPGSVLKIEIMRARAESGQQIFHPDDATAVVSTFEWAHGTDCL